ncbi:MAG TPA: lipocalin family protein, partial [Burkholderiaceae bacterium]|nr:lipocalin family protein [Burkholderiaceae bacterium]
MKNLLSLREPSPRHDGVGAASIDDRIRAIEQRLVAREHALALRFGALGERLRRAARPRRMLRPMLGIAGALFALWWLLHGRLPAQQAQRGARSGGDASWAHWLALVWPLLPPAWRSRVSPASAAALVSLGIPLAERLLGRRSYPPLDTAAQVDLTRYAGTWYEIARLPTPHESPCDA